MLDQMNANRQMQDEERKKQEEMGLNREWYMLFMWLWWYDSGEARGDKEEDIRIWGRIERKDRKSKVRNKNKYMISEIRSIFLFYLFSYGYRVIAETEGKIMQERQNHDLILDKARVEAKEFRATVMEG